jgi:predicted Zn-dependent peptidase
MNTQQILLPNGLRVLLIDTKSFPTVTTLLLVGAGSRYETATNNGIAHFLEHMFYKGSEKYPDPEVISQEIEGMGGNWNAFTSKDYTGYYIKASTAHFPKIIDILSDLLLRSKFDAREIEKEKGVIVEEINMYEDMPSRRVSELYEQIMYAGNPLGFDIAGTKETVTSFDRNTFVNYMNSLYKPQNAVLVVAGGLGGEQNEIKKYMGLIEEKFGGWGKDVTASFETYDRKVTESAIRTFVKKTEQAHFCLGFPTFARNDKRDTILKVLSTILGGGASSRLFQEVREKRGLCYYISTGIEQYEETGYIVTQAGVAKDPLKVRDALRATVKEHLRIAKGELRDEDIARSKEMLKGRLLLSLEDSFNVAHFYGMRLLHEKKTQTPEEVIAKIDAVKKEDIISLASQLFREETLHFAILGPFKEGEFEKKDMVFM